MTQYTGDVQLLEAQVREYLAGVGNTDEVDIAATHALAYANGGNVERAYVEMIVSKSAPTPHEALAFLDDIPLSDSVQADEPTVTENPKLRRQALAFVLRAGGDESLGERVYQFANKYGFSLELAYRYLTMPDDEPPPVAIDPRHFSAQEPDELQDDADLRARVFEFVLAQPDGNEKLAEDVYQLALAGVDMQLAYRELTTTQAAPSTDVFSLLGDDLFPSLDELFAAPKGGDSASQHGGQTAPFDFSALDGLGIDFGQIVSMEPGGAVAINLGALMDSFSARTGHELSPNSRQIIGHMVGEQLRAAAAGIPGVEVEISTPLLSPKQRLEAVVTTWALKGLMMYDNVKKTAGEIAAPITRRVTIMNEIVAENPRAAAEGVVRGLELSLRISAGLFLLIAISRRKTPAGARDLQWSALLLGFASIVSAAAKLAGILPMESKKRQTVEE